MVAAVMDARKEIGMINNYVTDGEQVTIFR